jgi:hypothetical protein
MYQVTGVLKVIRLRDDINLSLILGNNPEPDPDNTGVGRRN